MKQTLFFMVAALWLATDSLSQNVQFNRYYTMSTWSMGRQVSEIIGKGYYVFGSNNIYDITSNTENRTALAMRFNYYGDTIKRWEYSGNDSLMLAHYGFPGEDQLMHGCIVNDSNMLAIGITQIYNPVSMYDHDILLVMFNSELDTLWTKTINCPGDSSIVPYCIIPSQNGGYLIGGHQNNAVNGAFTAFVMKLDANCNVVWHHWYSNPFQSNVWSIAEAIDGSILYSGSHLQLGGDGDPILFKVDSNGNNPVAVTSYASSGDDYGGRIIRASDGDFVQIMSYQAIAALIPKYVRIVKLSALGNIAFDKLYVPSYGSCGPTGVIEDTFSPGFVFSGLAQETAAIGGGNPQGFLMKVDEQGDSLWCRFFGTPLYYTSFWDVTQTSDGGFLMTGQNYCCNFIPQLGGFGASLWLVKTDSLGFITTGINDLPGYHLYSMGQVYPNPANTVLHVPLDIPHATAAPATNGLAGNYLYVFDMQGRQLMQQKVQPGNSTAQLDVSTLAPGTYSMVLVAEGYSISHQKFVVLR